MIAEILYRYRMIMMCVFIIMLLDFLPIETSSHYIHPRNLHASATFVTETK
jgi:hypothetical protein